MSHTALHKVTYSSLAFVPTSCEARHSKEKGGIPRALESDCDCIVTATVRPPVTLSNIAELPKPRWS